jgi:hypothetical protein
MSLAMYRWLLRLYPTQFRRANADELIADVEALRHEAAHSGGRLAIIRCDRRLVADLLRSALREWLRTPWLAVWVLSGAMTAAVFGLAVVRLQRWRAATVATLDDTPLTADLAPLTLLVPVFLVLAIALAAGVLSGRAFRGRRRA